MHDSAHRLLRMVNGLLDVARIEADGLPAAPEPTDLAALTEDLLAAVRAQPPAAPGSPWRCASTRRSAWSWSTRRCGRRSLLNLVANAIKFTTEGTVRVDLRRRATRSSSGSRDTGVGIPESEQGPGLRAVPPGRTTAVGAAIEGTGIGLALVAEAARAMGGAATVTSALGVGSTFEVRSRCRRSRATAMVGVLTDRAGATARSREAWPPRTPAHETAPATDAGRPPAPRRRSILVAEDNPAMRARVADVLAELGRVVTAPDGRVALEVLRERHGSTSWSPT